jgi:hypothetical protein
MEGGRTTTREGGKVGLFNLHSLWINYDR